MSPIRRNQLCALFLLVGSAAARLPIERALTHDYRASELLPEKLETSWRDQMSQDMFVAVVGGFRSLVAGMVELIAFEGFYQDPPRWDIVDTKYALCCQLQPRDTRYWDMHSWMLASNAAEYYATEGGATQGREAELRKFYRDRGITVALRGIQHNPQSYFLYRQAANLYANPHPVLNPRPDHEKAAFLLLRASQCPDAHKPPFMATNYLYRLHLYELAAVPGQERRAYEGLLEIYQKGSNYPTTITLLNKLEDKLNIPADQRIPEKSKVYKSPDSQQKD